MIESLDFKQAGFRQACFNQVVEVLKALAEPTRCRLLALLRQGELTVGEIALVLEQSQPRISRHLKVLTDVAALERFREEQRIYYRLTSQTQATSLVMAVLSQLDADQPVLKADRLRLKTALEQRAKQAGASWAAVRRAAESTYSDRRMVDAVLKELGDDSLGELLDVGTGSGSLLRVLGHQTTHAVGLDLSTQALRVARARVHGAGLNQCVFKRGDMYALPFEAATFDSVAFDQVLSAADKPAHALREAMRVLRRGGRVLMVEDPQRIRDIEDEAPERVLRRWLERAGMHCDKLKSLRSGSKQLMLGIASK